MPVLSRSKSYVASISNKLHDNFPHQYTDIAAYPCIYILCLAKEPFIRDFLPGNMKHLPLAGDVESQPAKAPVWTGCEMALFNQRRVFEKDHSLETYQPLHQSCAIYL